MKVISGSLPPGLQFGEPICEWTITGTPLSVANAGITGNLLLHQLPCFGRLGSPDSSATPSASPESAPSS